MIKFYADGFTTPSYIATVGVDLIKKTKTVDCIVCNMEIWDTAGQEKFRTVTPNYYRGVYGIIVMYDVSSADSFQSL